MPESKIISTQTTLSVIGSSITINTRYVPEDTGIILAFISEIVGGETVDGVNFIEGEGGITGPDALNFQLDNEGNLIVNSPDAAQYSVDTLTGQLVYTY